MDYRTLCIDFGRVEGKVACPVVKDEEARVLYGLRGNGHVRNVVDSLVNRGVGVEVYTEFHALALEPVDDALTGIVGCAVEAHVLEEVSQAALVLVFEDRTYFLSNIEISLTLGLLVMTDIVGKSVVKDTVDYGTVHRQGLWGHLRADYGCHAGKHCQHSHTAHQNSLHKDEYIEILFFVNMTQLLRFTYILIVKIYKIARQKSINRPATTSAALCAATKRGPWADIPAMAARSATRSRRRRYVPSKSAGSALNIGLRCFSPMKS